MESSTSRQEKEERRQLALKRQIALLQAQLADPNAPELPLAFESPKRKHSSAQILAPASPSPKRRRKSPDVLNGNHRSPPKSTVNTSHRPINRTFTSGNVATRTPSGTGAPPKPPPSNVLSKLSRLNGTTAQSAAMEAPERSSSFADKPKPARSKTDTDSDVPARDDRLALIEELEPGPYDHKSPFDDPLFEKLEPNSGIHLTSRVLEHDDVQEYLTGRYYISPSKLYSVIRLLPHNQGYDVPVVGDWVTIAVVAQRGEIMTSRAPVAIGQIEERDADDPGEGSSTTAPKPFGNKGKGKDTRPPKLAGRKYVNMKLVDFGARSRTSANGGKAVIRGDAFLTLLLFESEGYDLVDRGDGGRPEKIYKGGSRGAFESMAKLREGSVVALLNPRILKPYKGPADTPHPTTNILALTPESASSALVIGHARDLGMCTVKKRDGKTCGNWCDKRVSDVCDYHIQNAVERRRAGRAEFSVGTSGMSTTAPKRKADYDPRKKWGLAPDSSKPQLSSDSGGATYLVSGHVVSGATSAAKSLFPGENMGRDAQARAQRKMGAREADQAVKKLLERDKEGMRAVEKAREFALKMKEKEKLEKAGTKGKGKEKERLSEKDVKSGKEKVFAAASEDESPSTGSTNKEGPAPKNAYSAEIIKQLGFDPTIKPGQRREEDPSDVVHQLRNAAARRMPKDIELGPRPGKRIRTSVSAPTNSKAATVTYPPGGATSNTCDSDDDELERQELAVFGKSLETGHHDATRMVDLDGSSDDDLVVEPPDPVSTIP